MDSELPQWGGYVKQRFSDEATRIRYQQQQRLPSGDIEADAPAAWATLQAYSKIEAGVDRLIVAALIGNDARPGLASGLSELMVFDHRLRLLSRLLKRGRLRLQDPSLVFDLPYPLQGPVEPVEAIRTAMRYRNKLFHVGVYQWIEGNDHGYATSTWVDGPAQRPAVPLVWEFKGKPALAHLVTRLAMGPPFYFGSPIFVPDEEVTVDAKSMLEAALRKVEQSAEQAADTRAEKAKELIERFAP